MGKEENFLDKRNTTIVVPVSLRKKLKRFSGMLDLSYAKIISLALDELEKNIKEEGLEHYRSVKLS